jgi:hypothetical protein
LWCAFVFSLENVYVIIGVCLIPFFEGVKIDSKRVQN